MMTQEWLFGILGGLLIGTASSILLLGNGRIAGISGIVGGVIDGIPKMRGLAEGLAFLVGLIGLPVLYTLTFGAPAITVTTSAPLLLAGGLLVGFGTRLGGGCTSGHGDWGGNTPHQQRDYPGSAAAWMSGIGLSHLADGPDNVRRATRISLASGATQIKIMAGGGVASLKDPLESVGFSEAEMRAAVEAATDYDTYVMAHAYNDESVQRCIRAGVKDIVHGHLLSEKTIKMMAENDVWLGSISSPYGLMDVPWFSEENRRKGREILAGYENVMKLAKKHGVKMGFGTDAAAQMVDTILYEFEMRSKFFTPLEMLKQATSTNAELLRFSNSRDPYKAAPLGVVKEGAWADMLIYDGNPLENIDFVTKPEEHLKVIIKDGKVYKNTL